MATRLRATTLRHCWTIQQWHQVAPRFPGSRFRTQAPNTVRVSASRPAAGDELTLHFVNYNRVEPAENRSAGDGAGDEKPIAAAEILCDVRLPEGFRAAGSSR